jgi:ATP-binding cassette, subfamily F, member 3
MLSVSQISKQYASKVLFEGADLQIGNRTRAALIGPNGAGKSTLIKILLGLEQPDTGVVSRARHLAIGHLAQEVPKFSGRNVLDEVMRLGGRRTEILEAKKELEEAFAKEAPKEEELDRYGRILEELEHLDEYRLEARAKEILGGMGFRPRDFERSLTEFSGGWLMRVALSRVLLLDPDLLLLDEPTNHLDLESLLWLEEFLRSFRGAMLLVSHDTEFLNRMVSEVLEIDQRRLWSYRGNLESYAAQKQERLNQLRAQYAGQQARIAEIEDFVRRFGAKATKARQAQSRLKELDRMERIELPDERETVRFRFPPAPHSGREVMTLKKATVAFGEKTVFKDLDFVLKRGSRLAIVGINGAGKTTLLKLLAGELEATSGEVKPGHLVKIGYYAQHQTEALDLRKTIQQELEAVAPDLPISRIRGIAGAFLFSGDAVEKKIAVLSGGEKARVALAKLLLSPSNFLLLDEPTNHLDIESRGVLLEALQDYEGTLCLVSHDRAFISPLVESVLEIAPEPGPTGGGRSQGSKVHELLGGYEDYLGKKVREISDAARRLRSDEAVASGARDSAATATAKKERTGPSNNQRRAWEDELKRLEKEISALEREQAEVQGKLALDSTYENAELSRQLSERSGQISSSLNSKLSRWEEVSLLLGG